MNLVDQLDSTSSRQDYGNNIAIAIAIAIAIDDDDDDDDGDGDGDEALLGQIKIYLLKLDNTYSNYFYEGRGVFRGRG